MKVARSRQALLLGISIAVIATALIAYASRADTDTRAVAVQPSGMSVPF
jgi:hypothetical protein